MKKFFLNSFIFLIFSLFFIKGSHSYSLKYYPYLKAELFLNLSQGTLKGQTLIELQPKKYYKLNIKNLTLKKILLDHNPVSPLIEEDSLKIVTGERSKNLYIEFETHFNIWSSPLILVDNFLPFPDMYCFYNISIKMEPYSNSWEIIIPHDKWEKHVENSMITYTFSVDSPVTSPTLILGKFKKSTQKLENYNLQIFYFNSTFLKALEAKGSLLKKLLTYYDEIIGPFPSKNLLILEVPFKSFKEFPNFIFIEESEIKRSDLEYFIVKKLITNYFSFALGIKETTLTKGLIEYLVDYHFSSSKELFRKQYLSLPENEGIGFFYILNLAEKWGEKNFLSLLRKFLNHYLYQKASLEDFQKFFSSYPFNLFHKIDLNGKINFLIEDREGYILELIISQTPPFRGENIEIKVETEAGWETFQVKMNKLKEKVELKLKSKPLAVYLDPEYKLWRKLSGEEIEPTLKTLLSSPGILICSKRDFVLYQKMINLFRERGYKLLLETEVPTEALRENVIYFQEAPFQELQKIPFKEGFYLKIIPNPYNHNHLIGFVWASSAKELEGALNQISSLDFFSEVFIKRGKLNFSQKATSSKGLKIPIRKNYWAVELNSILSLEQLLKKLIDAQIILVGLNFSEFSDYSFLNEFLKVLALSPFPIVIGLGELPKSFQKSLDDFLENRLSEKDFKDRLSEFPNREFYEKIILWAKVRKIKIVAMGVEEDLFKKVWKGGLKELTLEEKLKLPEIDLFNPPYKTYLESSLWQYLKGTQFENFYQAEILKNEHLAESLINFLKTHSNYKLILFSEKHRIIYGWGLPKNLQKREVENFKVIILDKKPFDNPNVGDFWIKLE
ncbi:MAG: ChaN family lipoprotein [Thermodesulfobacteriaceae bacterium]|nr:ChaN family lipoprotein [Thermodesulfobacteriaceae bacterium]